jgi:TPR repeat protein
MIEADSLARLSWHFSRGKMTQPINDYSALPAGTELRHYRLGGELGRGGFAITYIAEDLRLKRPVVIKEYLPRDFAARRGDYTVGPRSASVAEAFQNGLDSFLKEAQTLARFNHPNIVPVLDFFQIENSTAYLVMPFLPGETLAANLARHPGGRLNETEIRAWLEPILEGLRAIHAQGFLHRDLKPDNIYLQSDGSPVLIDFGSARQVLGGRTRSLIVVLTPGYAPVEQYGSSVAAQGPWSDLYALGAVIYRCLTGADPISSTERQEAVANSEPDPLIQKFNDLKQLAGPGLFTALEGCLRLARKERLQGVMELRQALSSGGAVKTELSGWFAAAKKRQALSDEAISKTVSPPPPTQPPVKEETRNLANKSKSSESKSTGLWGWLGLMLVLFIGTPAGLNYFSTSNSSSRQVVQTTVEQPSREKAEAQIEPAEAQTEPMDAEAQFSLGFKYKKGEGVPQDDRKAMEWWQKAADQGNAWAQASLGAMYFNGGQGVPKDGRKAVEWWRKAADQGNAWAQNKLGDLYENGRGVPQDNRQAVEWHQKAAEQGHAGSQYNLGLMYADGRGVPKDDHKAAEWWQKAATQSNTEAQYNLGRMYADGRGVPRDDRKAVEWWQKAADQGNAEAQNNLGAMYQNERGVPKDDRKAVEWYQKAADQGNAFAQCNLGFMYAEGRGVPKNDRQAVEWWQKAAAQGNAFAQGNLGFIYAEGRGVPQDDRKAMEWWQKAADQGNAEAQCNLGAMYKNGRGVPKDDRKAVEWYQKAADQGYARAQCNLGLMYENGRGVPKDNRKAVEWHQKAADQGLALAQFSLGFMYVEGRGLRRDQQKGCALFRLSADQGFQMATEAYNRLCAR